MQNFTPSCSQFLLALKSILSKLEIRHITEVKCVQTPFYVDCIHPRTVCVSALAKKPNKWPVAENQTRQEVSLAFKKACYRSPCSLCRSVCSWQCVKKGLALCPVNIKRLGSFPNISVSTWKNEGKMHFRC